MEARSTRSLTWSAALLWLILAYPVLRHTLDNGLTVLLLPNRAAPVVAVQAWVNVGAADESKKVYGIAHVFEHMLFKGTARRGVGEIAQDVESAGGEINAWTSFNQTVYHVVLASRYFDTAIDVLSDALMHSSFDPVELERERGVILEEIRQGEDDPGRNVAQALFSTAFVRHPYGRPVIGSADVVRRLTRDNLLEFYRTWYVANNLTLVVSGDFDPANALRRIGDSFGELPRGVLPRRSVVEPKQTAARAAVVVQDVREAQLAVGFHIPRLRGDDTAALDVLAILLGQGESSRLSAVVRRQRELVSSVYAYAHSLRDPGLFLLGATMAPDKLPDALAAMLEQTFRLGYEDVQDSELDKARRVIASDAVYQDETAQGAARKAGFYELVAGDTDFEQRYLEQARGLTVEQLRLVARKYLRPVNASVAALLPATKTLRSSRGRTARERRMLKVAQDSDSSAARAYAPSSAVPSDKNLVRELLPNGLRVVIKRDPTVPLVAIRAVWPGGLRYETTRNNGVNHLLGRMITRGCGNRDSEQIAAEVDEMAGSLSGFSGRNSFGLRSEWLAADWEAGFALMSDCILRPTFAHSDFMRERRRLQEDLATRQDSPTYVAFRLLTSTLYRAHPYRMDMLGTPASVARLTRKSIARYYEQNYPASGLTLVIVGDVEPRRVLRRVRAVFGAVPRGQSVAHSGLSKQDPFTVHVGPREVYAYLERQQAHLVVGFPGITSADADRYAVEVLMTVLSGQGGRLFLELRDRQGLAYRVGAFSVDGVDPGYLAVYISCSPDKLAAALAGIREQLRLVVQEGVTGQEVSRAIRYLLGTHEISLQRRSAIASAIAFHEAYGLGYEQYLRYARSINAVTAVDVQRVAAEYFNWDLAVIATVGPTDMSPEARRRASGVKQRAPKRRGSRTRDKKPSGRTPR